MQTCGLRVASPGGVSLAPAGGVPVPALCAGSGGRSPLLSQAGGQEWALEIEHVREQEQVCEWEQKGHDRNTEYDHGL